MKFLYFFILPILFIPFLLSFNKQNIKDSFEYTKVEKDSEITFHGIVKSNNSAELRFQNEGKIVYIPYTQGDFVKKGQVLAKLDGVLYITKRKEEQAQLREYEIKYRQAQNHYKRMNILHQAGAVSDNDWEDAEFDVKTKAEKIAIQKEKIKYANEEVKNNVILAPFDGYILEKKEEIGSYVLSSTPIISIINANEIQIEILIDSKYINRIKINNEIIAQKDGKKYTGKIKHLAKSSNHYGGYIAKIILDNTNIELLEGMNIEVQIPILNQNILKIPIDSVFVENNENYVYKITNLKNTKAQITKQKIKIAKITNENILVENGLKENELIVSKGINKIGNKKEINL